MFHMQFLDTEAGANATGRAGVVVAHVTKAADIPEVGGAGRTRGTQPPIRRYLQFSLLHLKFITVLKLEDFLI